MIWASMVMFTVRALVECLESSLLPYCREFIGGTINKPESDPALKCTRSFGVGCRNGLGGEGAMVLVRLCDRPLRQIPAHG